MKNNNDYLVEIDLPQAAGAKALPCVCGSCGWKGSVDDVDDIDSCSLTPGDPSPVGRCPAVEGGDTCGALAYLDRPYDRAVLKVDELVEQLALATATLENVLLHNGTRMSDADVAGRSATVAAAQALLMEVKP